MYVIDSTTVGAVRPPHAERQDARSPEVLRCLARAVCRFLSVLLALLGAAAIPSPVCGQNVQFEIASDQHSTIVWQVSHAGLLDCRGDCPECRAFRRRCQSYRWGTDVCPQPEYPIVAPQAPSVETSQEDEEVAAPEIEPMPDVPDLGQLSGSFGASGGAPSAAPNLIGDFFGSPGSAATLAVERLLATSSDIDELLPSASGSPYTATELPGVIEVHALGTKGPVAVFPGVGGTFTTSITSTQLLDLLQSDPHARIPIVNNAEFQNAAETALRASHPQGSTVFVPSESFAHVPDGAEPPVLPGNTEYFDVVYTYDYLIQILVVKPGSGAAVGRVRIADNNSALPQDRVFVDYNFFHNVPLTTSGVDVNRLVPGLEKTFLDRLGSVQLQFPMAVTLDHNILARGGTPLSKTEFGNIQIATKLLLTADSKKAITTGLGISLPTASDVNVRLTDGSELIRVENEAVHVIPYVAALLTPNDRFFAHAFVQLDVDTGGDTVYANPDLQGLRRIGIWNDQTFLFMDLGVGGWLVRDDASGSGLTGLAWTAELHYSKSVSDADAIAQGNLVVGNPHDDLDLLNGTVGSHLRWGQSLIGTLGYSFPLTSADRVFDGEFRVFLNRYF